MVLYAWCISASRASAEELTVSAASSLQESFVELSRKFEASYPGAKVILNFGSSGELAEQIRHGAPVDVFASAGERAIEKLAAKNLLGNSAQSFAGNSLVIICPQGAKRVKLDQLDKVESLAIGDPDCNPSGEYAKEALVKLGIFEKLLKEKKLVFAQNVRQTLAYVENASVGAGIVYATDAKLGRHVEIGETIPRRMTRPIIYQIALIKDSKHAKLSAAFVECVLGQSGKNVLTQRGFTVP